MGKSLIYHHNSSGDLIAEDLCSVPSVVMGQGVCATESGRPPTALTQNSAAATITRVGCYLLKMSAHATSMSNCSCQSYQGLISSSLLTARPGVHLQGMTRYGGDVPKVGCLTLSVL